MTDCHHALYFVRQGPCICCRCPAFPSRTSSGRTAPAEGSPIAPDLFQRPGSRVRPSDPPVVPAAHTHWVVQFRGDTRPFFRGEYGRTSRGPYLARQAAGPFQRPSFQIKA
jgi:hypothetical protein